MKSMQSMKGQKNTEIASPMKSGGFGPGKKTGRKRSKARGKMRY